MDWCIPVTMTISKLYVWFDALLGYVSALSEEARQANLQNAVSSGWPALLHLIGKQIWNDINFGESEADKDHMLLELERECSEVYRPKVEEAVNAKARFNSLLQPKKLNLPLSWLNTSIRILGLLWTRPNTQRKVAIVFVGMRASLFSLASSFGSSVIEMASLLGAVFLCFS